MKRILQNRILELGRGEEGVALVVTLAVFMFMYIFCAGVFAVGKMVKDRICLQNAADAAAYSAAVVQADTLSRIATINRAMSWTYAQMNKRRMDFIVHRWIEHARGHYEDDFDAAKAWVLRSRRRTHNKFERQFFRELPAHYADAPVRHVHGRLFFSQIQIHTPSDIVAEQRTGNPHSHFGGGEFSVVDNQVERTNVGSSPAYVYLGGQLDANGNNFNSQLGTSCYYDGPRRNIDGLQAQIDMDMQAIAEMNDREKELMRKMPERIETAAYGILKANVSDFGQCGWVVRQDRHPMQSGFFERLSSSAFNEVRFLEWGNAGTASGTSNGSFQYDDDEFEAGEYENILTRHYYHRILDESARWFPREPGSGFVRKYSRPSIGCPMYATWEWKAWYCPGCSPLIPGPACSQIYRTGDCIHVHDGCACQCPVRQYQARIEVDNSKLLPGLRFNVNQKYSKYYDCTTNGVGNVQRRTLRAEPWIVGEKFFSGAGTITVGVAWPNDNPWRSVLGKALSNIGLYHAFDPYLDWMVCFSSARAGYKLLHGPSEYEDSIQEYENDGRWPKGRIRINQKVRVEMGDRDYCIDWKELQPVIRKLVQVKNRHGWKIHDRDWHWQPEWVTPLWRQSWNLRQSDWDAVMIPVCRAASGAEERTDHARTYGDFREPCWGATDGNYLEDLVMNGKWIFPEDRASNVGAWYAFSAGPDKPLSISDYGYIDYEPGDLGGLLNKLPENYQGWQSNRGIRGQASVIKWPYRWRVSAPGARLNWVELQKEMLH